MSPYREYGERNLPVPETPDVEGLTTALDYFTEEYADISALDDKIRVRGMKWFSEHVNAEDFREYGCVDDEHVIKVGPIVLGQMFEQDDSEESEMKQRLISAISEGDVLLFEMNGICESFIAGRRLQLSHGMISIGHFLKTPLRRIHVLYWARL